ncbi:MAG: tetA 2 [Firmicutes bacterium]|nr:tetA 2 [Bacillota bacterium]
MNEFRFLSRNFVCNFLASFFFFGSYYLLLPTLPHYVIEIGASKIQTGVIIGLFTLAAVLCRPYFGKLADAYGRRRLMLFGAGFFGIVYIVYIVYILYCQASEFAPLYPIRLLHGLGYAAFIPASTAYAADLAPAERRGEVMGIFGITNVFAMSIFPAIGITIVNYTNSFSNLCVVGALLAMSAFLMAMIVREVRTPAGKHSVGSSMLTAARQNVILIAASAMFAGTTVYGALTAFLPVFAVERGFADFGLFFTMYAVGSLTSRLVLGKISDRFGRYRIIILGLLLLGLSSFLIASLSQFYTLMISGVCAGIGFGALVPSLIALVADKTKPQERGVALGILTSFLDLGISAGAIVLGFVGEYWGYSTLFGVGSLFPAAGILVIVVYLLLSTADRKQNIA